MSKVSELENATEMTWWLDLEKLYEKGMRQVAFGVARAKNGFGKPDVTLFCGAGTDKEGAAIDALKGIKP